MEQETQTQTETKFKGRGRSMLVMGVLLLMAVFAVAGVVTYLSNSVEADINVDSPVSFDTELFDVEIVYGGEYSLSLLKITNNANVATTGDIVVTFSDVEGFHTAVSEDISYCYKNDGNMSNVANCDTDFEQWVINNPDWMDWYADADYEVGLYEAPYVINHGGNSFYGAAYNGNTLVLPDQTIDPNTTVYGVLYVDSVANITPGSYTITVQLMN